VPRVASESNVPLPPLHNAGVRHRAAGNDGGGPASPFAALVDSSDASVARPPASRASANRAAPATDRNQRPSDAPPARNDSKPDRADAANTADAVDAAPDSSQSDPSQTKKETTDGTEATAAASPDEKSTQDASADATDLHDLLPSIVDNGTPAQPVATPPAAPVSVDVVLTAQSAPDGESSGVVATSTPATDAPTLPAAQSVAPDSAPAVEQPTADGQPATPEQAAASSEAAADNTQTTPTPDGKAAAATDPQPAATKAAQNPAPVADDKTAPEETATKPLTPSEQQSANAQPDAGVGQVGKRPALKPESTSADARKSDGATDAEDKSAKTAAAPADPKDPAAPADRPAHNSRRAHAEAPSVEDRQTASLATQGHDVSQKAPAESFHALLLANDQASATSTAAQTASAPTTDGSMEPAVPIAGLAVEIAARAQSGQNRFEIRLDPPELGRIDVRLDIDSSGQVTSRLVVERADTLEHLRRDSAGLERALQDAGLKTGENSLQFSLRDQGFAGRDSNGQSSGTAQLLVPDPDLAPVELAANAYGRMMRTSGVDIRV
jgi:flagellar hook-length control protein FliK